ncbi:Golgi-associated plant pathogenesis-related protein 1-like [Branchiostoma floridae]|uniref:Golgi-associated plant pathogenesis-related protein 1 n=1 Tax=Branchiostoma floridae TaxID=7739 RepID=A0A9J7LSS5_BRAFL|nr:Golgi-associated plant pathogenesis-related protein 1-like [Branchiostoma floridae]
MGKSVSKKKKVQEKPEEKVTFQQELLQLINEYRAKHGVRPLKMDAQMCRQAYRYCRTMSMDETRHSKEWEEGKFGESILMNKKDITARQVADMWYNESQNYTYGSGETQNTTENFTQMVWKSSQQFGAAKYLAESGKYYVTARYTPRGNSQEDGGFTDNVLPTKK